MLKVNAFEIKIKVDLLFIKSLMQITKKQIYIRNNYVNLISWYRDLWK